MVKRDKKRMIDGVGCYHFLHVVQCCLVQAAWLVRLMMALMGASLAQPKNNWPKNNWPKNNYKDRQTDAHIYSATA